MNSILSFSLSYLASLSMFPDCSKTSHTQATCSWVKPKEAIPPLPEAVPPPLEEPTPTEPTDEDEVEEAESSGE